MIRLAWRQFRAEAGVGAGALLVVGLVLAVTGPHLVKVYDAAPGQVTSTYRGLQIALAALLLVAPALIGIFFGAPLIARELETGTYRLAWTQSVTRTRWLVVKLVLVGLASSALAGGLSLMAAWWANPVNIESQNRFSPANFGMFGIVPFGYALFAFSLGATMGLLFRKTLPAMATTLAAYVGARLAVTYWIRPHFEAPATKTLRLGPHGGGGFVFTPFGPRIVPPNASIPNAWIYSTSIVDKAGHAPTTAFVDKACPRIGSHPTGFGVTPVHGIGLSRNGVGPGHDAFSFSPQVQHCLALVSAKYHGLVTYQPASRYWVFQAYETALFALVALALASATLWWVKHRLS